MHSEHTGAAPWFYGTGARIGKNNTHGSQYLNEMHGSSPVVPVLHSDWSVRHSRIEGHFQTRSVRS